MKTPLHVRPVSVLGDACPLRDEGALVDGSVGAGESAIDPDVVRVTGLRLSEPDVAMVGIQHSLSRKHMAVVNAKPVYFASFVEGVVLERAGRQSLKSSSSHGSRKSHGVRLWWGRRS